MTLRSKLAAIVMIILLSGLTLATVLTSTLLRDYLIKQVDRDLNTTYTDISNQIIQDKTALLSIDYYLAFQFYGEPMQAWYTESTKESRSIPDLSAYLTTEPGQSKEVPSTPFTTHAVLSTTEWRVLHRHIRDGQKNIIGEAFVALPLTNTYAIVDQIQRVLILSALFITAFGGVLGMLAVRRSLRPLENIEKTAAQIAQGDLTQRVESSPQTTEVGSLAHSLNTMLEQLEESFTAQEASETRMRQFVSDASHELRTPLAAIRGYGELYRMGALQNSEALDDTMRRIEDSATRMGTLVEDLLHLARLDERKAMKHEPVDLAVLALDAVSDLHALDPTRDVKIVDIDSGNPHSRTIVLGDEDKLRQVCANLIGNVARHTPTGSPVEVAVGSRMYQATPAPIHIQTSAHEESTLASEEAKTRSSDERPPLLEADTTPREHVIVEVRDHGPGIPAQHAARVFERFYRVDSSRNRKSGGSGLGLAIVSAVVNAHDGEVSVHDTAGGGLTVRIAIPAFSDSDV
ncbi:sensor histidine kinase [Timonella sp. A28]|uniref:sensor histidine kinase n=1 Tax=Timonella sp. A28 TaxID=3442640 RepID=UPI003EBFB546